MSTSNLDFQQSPKTVVRTFFEEFLNQGDSAVADALLSPEFVSSDGKNRESLKSSLFSLREGFPDLQFRIRDTITEGNLVVVRWSNEGTHRGQFAGMAPTGRHVINEGISIYLVEEGKIREAWSQVDRLGVLQQIGALPPAIPAQPGSHATISRPA